MLSQTHIRASVDNDPLFPEKVIAGDETCCFLRQLSGRRKIKKIDNMKITAIWVVNESVTKAGRENLYGLDAFQQAKNKGGCLFSEFIILISSSECI